MFCVKVNILVLFNLSMKLNAKSIFSECCKILIRPTKLISYIKKFKNETFNLWFYWHFTSLIQKQ